MTTFHDIEKILSDAIGLDPESIGKKSIADTVTTCMAMFRVDDVNRYAEMLESDPGLLEMLVEKVIVPETWFFRDRESFNFLKKYAKDLRSLGFQGKTMRLLSVPCSTGEEPYSIAMALLEAGLSPEQFQVDAVDVTGKAIETAKKAVYGRGSFRGEVKDYKERYFIGREEGFELNPTVAGLVHFYKDNFVQPRALWDHEPYQVIFCKNLLIYLTDDARKRVYANLERLLLPTGVLFAGHSEVMSFLYCGYNPVNHARSFALIKNGTGEEKAAPERKQNPRPPGHALKTKAPKQPRFFVAERTLRHRDGMEVKDVPRPGSHDRGWAAKVLSKARLLADRGDLQEALRLCEQLLRKQKHSKDAYYLTGLINLGLNAFDNAEAFFQKVLYLDPSHYEALLHMSLLYEKRGDEAKASIIRERMKRIQERGEASGDAVRN